MRLLLVLLRTALGLGGSSGLLASVLPLLACKPRMSVYVLWDSCSLPFLPTRSGAL